MDWKRLFNEGSHIYIPLWLDLLLTSVDLDNDANKYLHSTMVRFIILFGASGYQRDILFTFHYG